MIQKQEKKESLLLNLLLNIVIPTIILMKLSGETGLGVKYAIVLALSFPLCYGLYDFIRARKFNFFSALGVISILATGGISLLELDPQYIAIKEATVPAIFGIAVLGSLYTKTPLVKTFFYRAPMIHSERVDEALQQHGNMANFQNSLKNASLLVAGSFFLSSFLNYALARYLLISEPGTEAFNAELGRMTFLSFPVIAVPSTLVLLYTMYYVLRSITRLTQLTLDDIIIEHESHSAKKE